MLHYWVRMGTILHLRQKLSHSKLMFSLCGEAGAVQYQHHLEDATQMAWRCWSQKKRTDYLQKAKHFQQAAAFSRLAWKFCCLVLPSSACPHQLTHSCVYGMDWVESSVKYFIVDTRGCIFLVQRDAVRSQNITWKSQRMWANSKNFQVRLQRLTHPWNFLKSQKVKRKLVDKLHTLTNGNS